MASRWRGGSAGSNLIRSAPSTPVDTVMMTAARDDAPARRFDLDRIAQRQQALRRDAELHRQIGGEPREQRAVSLPAIRVGVALERAREIHRRDFIEALAAGERPEHEFDRGPPVAQILRQRLHAGDIGLAARRLLDRAVRAHQRREIVLHLAFARVALSDAQLLPRRRRIDVEPGARREPRHRIDVGNAHPVRAAIERHAEGARIGDAAPADAIARLDQREAPARGRDLSRRRNARRARADDRHIGFARGRGRAERRRGAKGGCAREKISPTDEHGFQIVSAARHCLINQRLAIACALRFVHRVREPKRNGSLLDVTPNPDEARTSRA